VNHEPSILEQNLVALFTRAYVPVRASPAFRARLLERLTRELERGRAPRRMSASRIAAAVLILAGVALAVWFATQNESGTTSRERLLARGETAVREDAADGWRALDEAELSRGIEFASGRMDLATAPTSDARVWLASAGRVDAAPNTSLSIASGSHVGSHGLTLDSGEISLERYAPDGRFEIATAHGRLVLERGALTVRAVAASDLPAGFEPGPAVRARLASGEAWLDTSPGRTLLGLVSDIYLQHGRIVTATPGGPAGLDGSALASGERSSAGASLPNAESAPVDEAPEAAKLTGLVHVSDGGVLHENFAVTLLREVRLPDVSDPERFAFEGTAGRFELPAVRPGTYRVFVEAHGFAVWQVDAPLALDAGSARAIDVALDRGVTVRGRVVEADTQRPIEGAVVLSEMDSPSQIVPFSSDADWMKRWLAVARTGPDGRFEFSALSRRAHVLRATREGFGASWSKRLDLADSALASEVEITLAPGGTVFGRVARSDGSPRVGAAVIASFMATDTEHACISYGFALTDASGAFSIADLAPGMYVVLHAPDAGAEPIDPLVIQVRVERGRSTEVELPGRQRGTRLSGRVLTADGTPLADADIMVQAVSARGADDWRAERTHTEGDFQFPGLEPATYQVFVGRGLGQNFVWAGNIEVPDAPEHRIEMRLDGGVIAGHVRDATSRAGLARAVLILESERERDWKFAGRGFTDASGRFAFPHLRPGNYRVHAYATTGRYGPERTADLWVGKSEGPRDVEIALAPGAALKILVRESGGTPLARVQLAFQSSDGEIVQHTQDDVTDTHGELAIPGIRPGRWTVRAEARGFATAAVPIELTTGEERALEISLTPLSEPK
jgi:protocatechuate 3,4-dioxygenase beta subunit